MENRKRISRPKQEKKTSWEGVNSWYDNIVGKEGHYYHRNIIIPNLLRLLKQSSPKITNLMDLACGQGVLGRHLPETVDYWGIDIAPSLVQQAQEYSKKHHLYVGDITQALPIEKRDFDCATIILALQNLRDAKKALENAHILLKPKGKLIIVLNHPCFRIPQHSHWGVDKEQWVQYRRLDNYMSPLEISIKMAPSKQEKSPTVPSFHRPLSVYAHWLCEAGFVIENMEEWISNKTSTGACARMENHAREEFPLFLCVTAVKRI